LCCILCYSGLDNGFNSRTQIRKGLISYYKRNGITFLKKMIWSEVVELWKCKKKLLAHISYLFSWMYKSTLNNSYHTLELLDASYFGLSCSSSFAPLLSSISKFATLTLQPPTIVVGWIMSYIDTRAARPKYSSVLPTLNMSNFIGSIWMCFVIRWPQRSFRNTIFQPLSLESQL